MTLSIVLFGLIAAAVVVVLVRGLINMMQGGPGEVSQKLMRMRVTLQAVALAGIMAALWWSGSSHG